MTILRRNHQKIIGLTLLFTTGFIAGCTTNNQSTTARTATEQLLLSTAADHAMKEGGLDVLAGRKVFLDAAYFDSYDSKYALGTIRDALSRSGALLQDNAGAADVIVEARSGALALDGSHTIFGLPSLGVPIPLAGTVQTPEIAFYKSERQRSIAKIALLAYVKDTRQHVYSTGPMDGKSFDKHSRLLFISWTRTDVPEKGKTKEAAQKTQTWYPQYDMRNWGTNMPMQQK